MYALPACYHWDLRIPRQLVQCFYYLQGLKSRLSVELDEDIRSLNAQALSTEEATRIRKRWRYAYEEGISHRSSSESVSRKRRRSGVVDSTSDSDDMDEELEVNAPPSGLRNALFMIADMQKKRRVQQWREQVSQSDTLLENGYVVYSVWSSRHDDHIRADNTFVMPRASRC